METNGSNTWDEAIDSLGAAIDQVNNVVPTDIELSSLEPVIDQVTLRINSPVLWAKVLMTNLDSPMSGPDSLDEEEKQFWMKVAFEIGPDWINKFRRIGAFMAVVEKA